MVDHHSLLKNFWKVSNSVAVAGIKRGGKGDFTPGFNSGCGTNVSFAMVDHGFHSRVRLPRSTSTAECPLSHQVILLRSPGDTAKVT